MTRKWILALLGLVVIALGVAVYLTAFGRSEGILGSGTVEARNIRVGSKTGGRIQQVRVREGDRVEAGQVLVTFEEQELLAGLEQARGRVAQAKANLEKMRRGYRPEEIAESRAAEAQAAAALEETRSGYRREQVAQARAELEQARAEAVNTERTYQRAQTLATKGVFSRQQLDDAEANWKMAVARQQNAEQRLAELERGYRSEQIAAAEARLKQAEAARLRMERGYRGEDVAAARAELEQAEGQLREAESLYRERQVLAPTAAVVEVLDVRPGDLIAPNTSVATLLELDQIYLRIYVPETQLGLVRVGQPAEVRVDSFPGQIFQGEVDQINQKAEFLPRNVQTREERIHQVFGVKIRIRDPEGRIRPGMAADVKLK
jgi:HlyD family secretion protein